MAKTFRHLYGPVPSRRLGRSLGIDLVPPKICTYDCVYCQIGQTARRTLLRKEYVPKEEVLEEVKAFLSEGRPTIDHFSLSGSGEPTLHSYIQWIIEEIKRLSSVPVAVITNGSLLFRKEVREDLIPADVVLPSLDAVSEEIFQKMNRPHPGFSIKEVIEGLVEFRKGYSGQIWLEILFCKGINDGPDELQKMIEVIHRIHPDRIDLNTVVRPPAEKWAIPLNRRELETILDFFGEKARIISEFDRHPSTLPQKDVQERILAIVGRRPLSLMDLSKGMGIAGEELEAHLRVLVSEGKIKARPFGDTVYYEICSGELQGGRNEREP